MSTNETKSKYDPALATLLGIICRATCKCCRQDIGVLLAAEAHAFYGEEASGIEIESE